MHCPTSLSGPGLKFQPAAAAKMVVLFLTLLSDKDQKFRRTHRWRAPTNQETTPSLKSINHQCVGNHHILRFPQTNSNKKKEEKRLVFYYALRIEAKQQVVVALSKKLF
jgi:hypothetical protein